MKISEDARQYARDNGYEQADDALRAGMEEKAKEFVESGRKFIPKRRNESFLNDETYEMNGDLPWVPFLMRLSWGFAGWAVAVNESVIARDKH